MFQTQKQLKKRIADLEQQLRESEKTEAINVLIKKTGLPKCESRVCRGCVHAAIEHIYDNYILLGCTKDLDCKDYAPKETVMIGSITGGQRWI